MSGLFCSVLFWVMLKSFGLNTFFYTFTNNGSSCPFFARKNYFCKTVKWKIELTASQNDRNKKVVGFIPFIIFLSGFAWGDKKRYDCNFAFI